MIGSIIGIIICTILLIVIINKRNNINSKGYEYSTKISKAYLVISIIFLVLGYICLILSIILGIIKVPVGDWVLFGVGIFLTIISIIIIYSMMFEKEYIHNNTIIIRRFFKDKVINIKDIALVKRLPVGFVFYNKEQKKLFTVDINTGGLDGFITLLLEKAKQLETSFVIDVDGYTQVTNVTLDPTEEEDKEEIEKYIEIGKCYKNEYNERIKEYKFNLISIIIYCACFIVAILLSTLSLFVLIIGIVGCLFVPNAIKKYKQKSLDELQRSDFEVGQSCAFKASNVVGNNIKKYRYDIIVVIVLFLLSISIGLGIGIDGINKEKVEYDKLSSTSGTLLYAYEYFSDSDFIGFAIEGENIEYRLPEVCLDTFDMSMFDLPHEDEEGNIIDYEITIYYVDNEPIKDYSKFNPDENSIECYLDAYYIKIGDKEYFNETLYNQAFTSDKIRAIISGAILVVASIGCASVLVYKIIKYNKEKTKEIYKL